MKLKRFAYDTANSEDNNIENGVWNTSIGTNNDKKEHDILWFQVMLQ